MRGPKRYTDLAETLGIGTNILAARLRDLEAGGVVTKRTLPPPAASRVYELTDYGRELKVGDARARALGSPLARPPDRRRTSCSPAGSTNAIDIVLAPVAPPGRFEFRVGDEIASLVDGEARPGPVDEPGRRRRRRPPGPLPHVRRPAARSRHGSAETTTCCYGCSTLHPHPSRRRPQPRPDSARRDAGTIRSGRGAGDSYDKRPGRNLRRRVHGTGMTVMWGRASPSGRSPRAAARAASPAQRPCS